jgi:hypothetical protein
MSIVHLSPVEQAFVAEVAAQAAAAQQAIQQQASAKLAVVLDAHGLAKSGATFHHDGQQWTLALPAPAADEPPINDP